MSNRDPRIVFARFVIGAVALLATSESAATLEDIYGDTGNTFQGALGFINFQGTIGFPAKGGFGEAIDDMVIEWREFTLETDSTDCDAGSCATVALDTDRIYAGERMVTFRVMDSSPYAHACDAGGEACYPADPDRAPCAGNCVAAANDCDRNDLFLDAADSDDCDGNGAKDVIVVMSSEAEPLGESVVANEITPGSGLYLGSIAVSSFGDSEGVLFVAQGGADNPTITARYADLDDGTGDICQNSVVPASQGFVTDATVVLFDRTCDVLVRGFTLADNGDGDDYADTNETVTVTLELANACEFDLTHCRMRIGSNSPDVACIFNPVIPIGRRRPRRPTSTIRRWPSSR